MLLSEIWLKLSFMSSLGLEALKWCSEIIQAKSLSPLHAVGFPIRAVSPSRCTISLIFFPPETAYDVAAPKIASSLLTFPNTPAKSVARRTTFLSRIIVYLTGQENVAIWCKVTLDFIASRTTNKLIGFTTVECLETWRSRIKHTFVWNLYKTASK